jgi:uncharacterized protein (TIGR02246 family)
MSIRHIKLHFTALLVLLAGLSPAQDAGKHAAEVQAIKENEIRWNREFASKDLEKIAAHYADDATVMVPGLPASMGKEAIRQMLSAMVADPMMSLKFQTLRVEVAASGDMACSMGSFTAIETDPSTKKPVSSAGSYVTLYKKQAGAWKAVFDIASQGPDESAPMPKEKKQ